jgi:hypothetical protein
MKSGIFYKGGLDAKTRHDPYPIQGLDQFIFDLAMALHYYQIRTEEGYPLEFQEEKFDEALAHLMTYIAVVKIFKGTGEAGRFKTLVKKLTDLKKEVIAKPDKKIRVSKSKIKEHVAAAFRKHVQAPGDCMAERSAQLLDKFGMSATADGMREYFKNK